MGAVLSICSHTKTFYQGFFYYLFGKGRHSSYDVMQSGESSTTLPKSLVVTKDDTPDIKLFKQHARIHLFSLASTFYLYNKPHYRKGSYKDDLIDNLRNVAIPGTGIPMSLFVKSKLIMFGMVVTVYPTISFIASVHKWFMSKFEYSLSDEYATRLLNPDDWWSYWRLNCNVVGLHSLLNNMPKGYDMENKWTFLQEGDKLGVPVSPYMKTPTAIVVKHRNEEGGMGIHFYKNAMNGGDWIIQETISNSNWVSTLLPSNAPLSTFRVITQSKSSIDINKSPRVHEITALSCVFRAGRQNAKTDHDSILFDVDVNTGLIQGGTTNAHWYRLGLLQFLPGQCPWRSYHNYQTHPDGGNANGDNEYDDTTTNKIAVSGNYVPDIKDMLALVEHAHYKMCPDVPFAGWDVVLSSNKNLPVCLLEVNLSCNFFRGSFNKKVSRKHAFAERKLISLDLRVDDSDKIRDTSLS